MNFDYEYIKLKVDSVEHRKIEKCTKQSPEFKNPKKFFASWVTWNMILICTRSAQCNATERGFDSTGDESWAAAHIWMKYICVSGEYT